jgi:hypothetical protein
VDHLQGSVAPAECAGRFSSERSQSHLLARSHPINSSKSPSTSAPRGSASCRYSKQIRRAPAPPHHVDRRSPLPPMTSAWNRSTETQRQASRERNGHACSDRTWLPCAVDARLGTCCVRHENVTTWSLCLSLHCGSTLTHGSKPSHEDAATCTRPNARRPGQKAVATTGAIR